MASVCCAGRRFAPAPAGVLAISTSIGAIAAEVAAAAATMAAAAAAAAPMGADCRAGAFFSLICSAGLLGLPGPCDWPRERERDLERDLDRERVLEAFLLVSLAGLGDLDRDDDGERGAGFLDFLTGLALRDRERDRCFGVGLRLGLGERLVDRDRDRLGADFRLGLGLDDGDLVFVAFRLGLEERLDERERLVATFRFLAALLGEEERERERELDRDRDRRLLRVPSDMVAAKPPSPMRSQFAIVLNGLL